MRIPALGLAVVLTVSACGDDDSSGEAAPPPAPTTTEAVPAPLSRAEFVRQADTICLEVSSHFDELPDPVGGAKPVGLGSFMRDWVLQLRALAPPVALAEDWTAGLDLLDQAADALDRAEAGDRHGQGEALWVLEPRAHRHFDAMRVPFHFCFVG